MIGKKIANLIGVRTIVTLSITGALIYGFVCGKVNNEQFMTIATMIFTFYFAKEQLTKETELEEIKKVDSNENNQMGRYG